MNPFEILTQLLIPYMDIKSIAAVRCLSKAIREVIAKQYVSIIKNEVVRVRKLLLSLGKSYTILFQRFIIDDKWRPRISNPRSIYLHFIVSDRYNVSTYKYRLFEPKLDAIISSQYFSEWPYERDIGYFIEPVITELDRIVRAALMGKK